MLDAKQAVVQQVEVKKKQTLEEQSRRFLKYFKSNWGLYLFALPALLILFIFSYGPMYGIQIAFKDYSPFLGITGSPWVGFNHFIRFFNSPNFWSIITNTLKISITSLMIGFPLPIIFSLLLNQIRSEKYKKVVQTVTYMPHFISTVVLVGMLTIFLSPSTGLVNQVIKALGGKPIAFLQESKWFLSTYVGSGVWQGVGWGSIIYIAALAGVDPSLHEAAIMDGASKLKRIWHIDIPCILPTIIIQLIMQVGSIMGVGFEKVYLMQNDLNMNTSEVISTYVYKIGIQNHQFSFSTAVNLFNSIINFILLISVNRIAKSVGETSLW